MTQRPLTPTRVDNQHKTPVPTTQAHMILVVLIVASCCLAWTNRFIQDDAFISLRYARNLAEGYGLVWNPGGERVEGYTNFLWTIIVAVPLAIHADPVTYIYVLGVAMIAGTLLLTYLLALQMFNSSTVALAAVVIAGANYSLSCYATGGLETQLQTLFLTACAFLVARAERIGRVTAGTLLLFSLLTALAALTRLDSGILVAVMGLTMCWLAVRDASTPSQAVARLGLLALPIGTILGCWLAWKYSYYEALLPNTFYVKAGHTSLLRGSWYVILFLAVYLFFVPLCGVAFRLPQFVRALGTTLASLVLVSLALWMAYVIRVGGDFMEFRFMVPIIPLIAIISAWAIEQYCVSARSVATAIAVMLTASYIHAAAFDQMPWKRGIESVSDLGHHLTDPNSDWIGIGNFLGEKFGQDPSVVLAVTPAGAIPYFSRLTSIDMLGLNDKWIAVNGAKLSDRPGHQRISPVAYLVKAKATFVVGHPTFVSETSALEQGVRIEQLQTMFVGKPIPDPQAFPADVKVVLIPYGKQKHLLAIYLTPRPEMTKRLEALGWRLVPIVGFSR